MCCVVLFLFQAEDGIRDLVRSRGLGDVYKRQEERGRMVGFLGGDFFVVFFGRFSGILVGLLAR